MKEIKLQYLKTQHENSLRKILLGLSDKSAKYPDDRNMRKAQVGSHLVLVRALIDDITQGRITETIKSAEVIVNYPNKKGYTKKASRR